MDVAAPAPPDQPGLPPPAVPAEPAPETVDRILGGVAGLIAARLGFDPLWVRLAFVLLALAGGLGVIVYAGLWLTLVVGADPERTLARYGGGALIVVGVPLLIGAGSFDMMSGPVAVIGLLVGLTVALWQPRAATDTAGPGAPARPVVTEPDALGPGARRRRSPLVLRDVAARPPRPRSLLGRATLGLAIVTAAVGALIDEANGGRLHPEQWLGVAAGVCGLGLLVGAWRGRARWLVLPAAAFAVSGFVAGVAAEVGVDASDLADDRTVHVDALTAGGSTITEELAFGTIDVDISGAPSAPVDVVVRLGIGAVDVSVPPDVTVEVRGRLGDGDVQVIGVTQATDHAVVGPEGPPDVVVEVSIERGSIDVAQYRLIDHAIPPLEQLPPIEALPELPTGRLGELREVADGVAGTADGWIVLAGGEAVIAPDDRVVAGETYPFDDSSTVVNTSWGEYRLLPRSILLAPTGEVFDLAAIRSGLVGRDDPAAADPTTTTEPSVSTTSGG